MAIPTNIMREAMILRIRERMAEDSSIFFVSADFGAQSLDGLRDTYPDRFLNVGIAEQNCINVCTGLALEGFKVFAYGIAPFISMRPYEQIRINLSLLTQTRRLNVNIISVGAGVSYDVSGPTHHCLEDISVMRTLPHVRVFSPCDAACARQYVDHALEDCSPKYIRLDGKALPEVYGERDADFSKGFSVLRDGTDVCIVATGVMTHTALAVAKELEGRVSVGVIDAFLLDAPDEDSLGNCLRKYARVATLEEAFIGCGGLDSLISCVLDKHDYSGRRNRFGFQRSFNFDNGGRLHLHRAAGIDPQTLVNALSHNKMVDGL